MNSIISYKDRGNYGKSNYRGNCSGYVIKDLVEHFKPKSFCDITKGSGTSEDIIKELFPLIRYVGLDLHTGFDFTKHSVLSALENKPCDMVFSHLPYFNMVNYELERHKHGLMGEGLDLSKFDDVDEFLEFSQLALLNQREASSQNGIYTTLMGDYRKDGQFYSFQADFIKMMPKNELLSVVIKQQFNMQSNAINYTSNFVPIVHEYLLIWKKKTADIFTVIYNKASEIKKLQSATWKNLIRLVLMKSNGTADLNTIYNLVVQVAPEKVQLNPHFKAKVRQTLQYHFNSVERGVWSL